MKRQGLPFDPVKVALADFLAAGDAYRVAQVELERHRTVGAVKRLDRAKKAFGIAGRKYQAALDDERAADPSNIDELKCF